MKESKKCAKCRWWKAQGDQVEFLVTALRIRYLNCEPVTESIKGNHNYLKCNFFTLLPYTEISHKDNISQLSINIIRTTSKIYKMLGRKRSRRQRRTRRRIIETRSIISNSFISRFYIALFTRKWTAKLFASSAFIRIYIETQKVYYFIFMKRVFSGENNSWLRVNWKQCSVGNSSLRYVNQEWTQTSELRPNQNLKPTDWATKIRLRA